MVQIGNEINAGILWDDGKIADNASNWNNLAELLKAGCRAVKDVSPEIQTVLHVDDGSDLSMCQDFYANCIENGVDFDVIGLSYYTTWCGSLDQLSETMTALAERYGKPVCVVENSQPWCSGEYTFTGETEKYPAPYWDRSNFLQSCSPGSNRSQTGWVLDILHGNRFGLNLRKRIISGTMAAS